MDQIEKGNIDIKKINSMKKEELNRALLSIGFEKGEVNRYVSINLEFAHYLVLM